jgi:hypothetical protein
MHSAVSTIGNIRLRRAYESPMMDALELPSVRAIRIALEEIPGALRDDEPLPEGAGEGTDAATEIWISDPDPYAEAVDAPGVLPDDDPDDVLSDGPAAIFEVPPEITDAEVKRILGEDRVHELERSQQIRGVDALGWYVTFHQRKHQYGVPVPLEGALLLAVQAFHKVEVPVEQRVELAFHAILRHEVFHFAADCMAANWELATGVDVYWNSRGHRNTEGYIELEEALANAYMLRGFKHPTQLVANSAGAYQALKGFCERQPAGYNNGPRYARTRRHYIDGCRWLSAMFHDVSNADWHVPDAFDTLALYPDPVRIDWTRCPVIVLDRHDLMGKLGIRVSYFHQIAELVETPSFQRAVVKLDRRIQKSWQARKEKLAQSTQLKSLDFKQWQKAGPDHYSVRVDGNYRAHLRYDRGQFLWFAEAIGNHKAMGHG